MKMLLIAVVLSFVTYRASASDAAKIRVCNEQMALTTSEKPPAVQIAALISILDVGYQLKLNPYQYQKLTAALVTIAKQPGKISEMMKNAYFVCTTELTAEDRAIGKKAISNLVDR